MILLQFANDTITMSELTKVIQDANETPILYYFITGGITLIGAFLGVFGGYRYTRHLAEKDKKDIYTGRLRYICDLCSKTHDYCLKQKKAIEQYKENVTNNFEDNFIFNIVPSSALKNLKDSDNVDTYNAFKSIRNVHITNDYSTYFLHIEYLYTYFEYVIDRARNRAEKGNNEFKILDDLIYKTRIKAMDTLILMLELNDDRKYSEYLDFLKKVEGDYIEYVKDNKNITFHKLMDIYIFPILNMEITYINMPNAKDICRIAHEANRQYIKIQANNKYYAETVLKGIDENINEHLMGIMSLSGVIEAYLFNVIDKNKKR